MLSLYDILYTISKTKCYFFFHGFERGNLHWYLYIHRSTTEHNTLIFIFAVQRWPLPTNLITRSTKRKFYLYSRPLHFCCRPPQTALDISEVLPQRRSGPASVDQRRTCQTCWAPESDSPASGCCLCWSGASVWVPLSADSTPGRWIPLSSRLGELSPRPPAWLTVPFPVCEGKPEKLLNIYILQWWKVHLINHLMLPSLLTL